MSSKFVGYGKKLFDLARGGGKSKVSTTIVGVDVAKNLATKRAIQDKVTKTVDKAFKDAGAPPSIANKQAKSKLKKEEGKKLKSISYRLDELEEKVKKRNKGSKKLFEAFKGRKFNKGGRVGLKFGSKRKSNVQKIKETFGPGSSNPKKSAAKKKKFPDLTGDGKVTFADILKGRGVKRG